jgi:O-antigen ligase
MIKKWVIRSHLRDIFWSSGLKKLRADGEAAMRRGGMTKGGPGAPATRLGRVAGWAWPSSLLPFAGAIVALLLVTRSWYAVAAVAMAGLAVLAVCGPAAMVGLVPLSLLVGMLWPGVTTPTLGAVAVVTLVVAVQVVAGTRRPRAPQLWVLLLALLLLVAFFFSPAPSTPVPDRTADLIGLFAGLGLLAAAIASPPPPGAIARVTALAGGVAAGCALVFGERVDGRLEGLGLNPNFLGALLALPLVAAAGQAWRHRRPAWLLPAAACLAGMVATQSRGAFVAGAVGVAVVVIQGRRRAFQVLTVSAATAAGLVFPGAIDAAERVAVGGREAAELSKDSSIREHVAWFAARVAAEHPLRGIGYGMFPSHAESSSRLGIFIATHNDYLRLAAEAGIPALIAFLVLVWLGVRRPALGDLAVPRAMVVAYAVGLLFANELANLPVSMAFWLSLGCLLAASRTPALRHKEFSAHDRR